MQVNVSCACMLVHRFQNEATMWEWPSELETQCILGYMVSCNTAFCMLEMRNDWQGFMHAQLQYTAAGGVVLWLQVGWCGGANGGVWGLQVGWCEGGSCRRVHTLSLRSVRGMSSRSSRRVMWSFLKRDSRPLAFSSSASCYTHIHYIGRQTDRQTDRHKTYWSVYNMLTC